MSGLSIPGQPNPTANPLKALTEALTATNMHLKEIAQNTRPDATAVLPHRYGVLIAEDKVHGKVWGSVCMACSDSAGEFIYPCRLNPDEQLKPPAFFTIGDVFEPDAQGRLLRHGTRTDG